MAAMLCVPLAVSVTAKAANDVDNGTRWSSVAGPGTQWLRIDLGAVQSINRVKLNWERAYASTYRIQTSADGTAWTDIYATRSGDGGIDDLQRLQGAGRYLRVLALQR